MNEVNEDIALLYGILLGDGCINEYKRKGRKNSYLCSISITCNALDDKPFFNKVVNPLINKLRKKETKWRVGYSNKIEFNFHDRDLFYKLSSLEFVRGKKGNKIYIPEIFYKNNLVKYIVQGFFATDGCLFLTKNPHKYYPRVESHANCINLLKQIYEYLNSIGMNGGFYKCSKRYSGFKSDKDSSKFQFNGLKNLLIFNEKIGFVNPKHQTKFNNFIGYTKHYDNIIKNIPSQEQKDVRLNVSKDYFNASGGNRTPISSS